MSSADPLTIAIIDGDEDLRLLLGQLLSIEYPSAEIREHLPTEIRHQSDALQNLDILYIDCAAIELLEHSPVLAGRRPCIALVRGDVPTVVPTGVTDLLHTSPLSRAAVQRTLRLALAEIEQATRGALAASAELEALGETMPTSECAAAVSAPINLKGYTIHKEIGRGGMATVYLAEHLATGKSVAIKILDSVISTDDVQIKRFMNEFTLHSMVSSRFVAQIYEHGFADDHIYLVMEYFPGGDLRRVMSAALAPKRALILLFQLAIALEDAHRCGILHRDLKPQNVLFRADRSIALTDFGVSRHMDLAGTLTVEGEVLGTPHYMSPEQGRAEVVDARSDLYSLGAMFFEMLTGTKPYQAKSIFGLLYMHANADVPVLPGKLAIFQPIISHTLAKSRDDRFTSATQLLGYIRTRWASRTQPAPAEIWTARSRSDRAPDPY